MATTDDKNRFDPYTIHKDAKDMLRVAREESI